MTLSVKTVASLEKTLMKINKIALMEVREAKSAEHAASIFREIACNSSPLAVDAKSISTMISIKKQSDIVNLENISRSLDKKFVVEPPNEYKIFKRNIGKEIEQVLKSKQDAVFEKINPINSSNIDLIKTELTELTDNEAIRQKITDAKTPKELFYFIKKHIDEIESVDFGKLYAKAKTSGVTAELENEYSKLGSHQVKRFNTIINLLTPKSVKPEVLKIEEEVRKLGVTDVNFSDDLEQAILIKKALNDLIKGKIPLPTSITVTPALSEFGGMGAHVSEGGYVWLKTSTENKLSQETDSMIDGLIQSTTSFQKAPTKFQEQAIKELGTIKGHLFSTKNPKHKIYHEVAHTFELSTASSNFRTLNTEEMNIASEISYYAKSLTNGMEAMPEMFAKLMDGQQLTDKQMALYIKLGGIVPQF